jgi:hypothetical protein
MSAAPIGKCSALSRRIGRRYFVLIAAAVFAISMVGP